MLKMGFNKKHYEEIQKFMDHQLAHTPWCYEDTCPFEWARTFLPLISDCIYREDYEAAKASTDAIREFLNRFLPINEHITENDQLKLPEIKDYLKNITRAAIL